MPKSLLKSALLAGLVVFVWGIVSWMVLPFHHNCLNKFSSESRVASVIRDNAPTQGMYVLPYTLQYDEGSSSEEMQRAVDMMENGPFMFAAVVPQGLGKKMVGPFVISYIIQFVGALIVCWMLMQTRGLDRANKVLFATLYGVAVGVLGYLPAWNWVGFSGSYVILSTLDLAVGWCLAGLVIAKTLKVVKR